MGKDTINVKSNGLRNELKEIRKSIDRLTNAILMEQTNNQKVSNGYSDPYGPPYTIMSTSDTQTNDRYEESTIYHRDSAPDGMRWVTDFTGETDDVSGND